MWELCMSLSKGLSMEEPTLPLVGCVVLLARKRYPLLYFALNPGPLVAGKRAMGAGELVLLFNCCITHESWP